MSSCYPCLHWAGSKPLMDTHVDPATREQPQSSPGSEPHSPTCTHVLTCTLTLIFYPGQCVILPPSWERASSWYYFQSDKCPGGVVGTVSVPMPSQQWLHGDSSWGIWSLAVALPSIFQVQLTVRGDWVLHCQGTSVRCSQL